MRIWTTLLLLFAGCSDNPSDNGDNGDDDDDDDDTTDVGTDTDTDLPVGTGVNTSTTGSSQQCLLLFGGADRVVGQDIYLPEGTEAREMHVWVRTRSVNREMVAFSYGRPSTQQGLFLGTTVGGFPMLRAGLGTNQILGTTNIADDEWHHLVATWEGVLAAILVDGVVDAFGELEADTLEGDAVAGNAPTGDLTTPWIGWVDDVKVFEGAREPQDVAADPDGELIPAEQLKLHWDFEVDTGPDDGGVGFTVPDLAVHPPECVAPCQDGISAGTDETPRFPACR
jgi:hypothetical protein